MLKKEIHQLRFAGFALLGMIILFILLLFIHFLTSDPNPDPSEDFLDTQLNVEFFANVPTMIASYSFQPSLFTAYASLKNKTTANGLKASWTAVWVAYFTYTVVPLLGFGLYGAKVKGNLLKNISDESGALPTILQCLFLIIAVVHIPIIFFIGKEAVLTIFDEITRGSYSKQHAMDKKIQNDLHEEAKMKAVLQEPIQEDSQNNNETHRPINQMVSGNEGLKRNRLPPINSTVMDKDPEEQKEESTQVVEKPKMAVSTANPKEYLNMKPVYYYVVTLTIYVIVVVLSILIDDVTVFFGVIGATVGTFLILAGPGSFYVLSVHKHNVPIDTWYKILIYAAAWFYTILGFSAMFALDTCVIINAVRN